MSEAFRLFNGIFNNNNERAYLICGSNTHLSTGDTEIYSKSKHPIHKWKNVEDRYTYDEVVSNTSNKVGLVINDGFVVVDIDRMDEGLKVGKLLYSLGYKFFSVKTAHGFHFYFKNSKYEIKQGAGCDTPISIKCDFRVPGTGYIVLPEFDKEKSWALTNTELDDIPFFLVKQKKIKDSISLVNLTDGDGRNTKLHDWYLKLSEYGNDLSEEDIEKTIKLINKFIFKDPISDDELENTVLRFENKKKSEKLVEKADHKKAVKEGRGDSDKGSKIEKLFELATIIMSEQRIIYVGGDSFYIFGERAYEPRSKADMEELVLCYKGNLSRNDRGEILDYIKIKSKIDSNKINQEPFRITVGNGILDLATKELTPFTSECYDTITIPIDYNTNVVKSERYESFMEFLTDGDIVKRRVIEEMLGYSLMKKLIGQSAHILYGRGQNGKSTLLNLLRRMIGEQNYSAVGMDAIANDKFAMFCLKNKLVNICGEINRNTRLSDTAQVKALISGDPLYVQEKHSQGFAMTSFCNLIFATNFLPTSSDLTDGFFRRWIVVDLLKKIPDDKKDPLYDSKFKDSDIEWMLVKSVEAISNFIGRGCVFTQYEKSENLKNKYMVELNSCRSFFRDKNYTNERMHRINREKLYLEYNLYCTESGFLKYNKSKFELEVEYVFDVRRARLTDERGQRFQGWLSDTKMRNEIPNSTEIVYED